jgi:hypothetical protein
MQAVTTIGLDIAKSVFQIHGVDAAGNARQNETTTAGFNGVFEVPPPVPSRPISASTGRLICDDAFVLVACALQAHG